MKIRSTCSGQPEVKKEIKKKRVFVEEIEKMSHLSIHKESLENLETSSHFDQASIVIADLISNPPDPLTDLRRADSHRVTFVGKNVKRIHAQHWKDMVAISSTSTPRFATASFFRNRIKDFISSKDS